MLWTATEAFCFKSIFTAFKDINLLNLRSNLRANKNLAFNRFHGKDDNTCPLQHGAPSRDHFTTTDGIRRRIRTQLEKDFTRWWDKAQGEHDKKKASQALLLVIEQIWQERLADAESMQSMLVPQRRQLEQKPTGQQQNIAAPLAPAAHHEECVPV